VVFIYLCKLQYYLPTYHNCSDWGRPWIGQNKEEESSRCNTAYNLCVLLIFSDWSDAHTVKDAPGLFIAQFKDTANSEVMQLSIFQIRCLCLIRGTVPSLLRFLIYFRHKIQLFPRVILYGDFVPSLVNLVKTFINCEDY